VRRDIDPTHDSGYAQSVTNVSLVEDQSQLPELIRAVEDGQTVVITRQRRPIAQIGPPPHQPGAERFGLTGCATASNFCPGGTIRST